MATRRLYRFSKRSCSWGDSSVKSGGHTFFALYGRMSGGAGSPSAAVDAIRTDAAVEVEDVEDVGCETDDHGDVREASDSGDARRGRAADLFKAVYSAPGHESFTATHEVASEPASASASSEITTAAKTAHLAALRKAVKGAQDEINKELTARMVLDVKDGEAAAAAAKEEENYGEEMVEED
ncbi:hypothetical protein F503_00464 [Ophiostoma piceae UAMH 11346]|uniref:EKC/KEOPS complex subunit GON7 n=1 Tax=Ophiostoma piceae (strain UAMH 11346) TaxID=1262450 RepID=S3C4N0_OPHP1|nr:hypothetical protein F503_00464 [Ophiostoma piceae UAMH 11346]